jgi:hypothetical protein
MKLTPIAVEQLRDHGMQRNKQQQVADKAFIADLKNSNQLNRMLDNNLIMLKHKIIPEALATGKSEIEIDPAFNSFLAPWIVNDSKLRLLALEAFKQILKTAFNGYTIFHITDTDKFKISWANII